jgi:DNA adenine methylase
LASSWSQQLTLFRDTTTNGVLTGEPLKPPSQLLKWVGNKQRFAPEITRYVPPDYGLYVEPFVGTGAVLGALAPRRGLAGDTLEPLIGIWLMLQNDLERLVQSYSDNRARFMEDPQGTYITVRDSFNSNPNPLDLLFISRSCYGGVVRFTKDGTISTPIGPYTPIAGEKFRKRALEWQERVKQTRFACADFEDTMSEAGNGDIVYCDPPYVHCQSILYGAQEFSIDKLWGAIEGCARRGAKVMLSIDGQKKSGKQKLKVDIPEDLFAHEIMIDCGRSMLRRFQLEGETLEDEVVHDRLLLTW